MQLHQHLLILLLFDTMVAVRNKGMKLMKDVNNKLGFNDNVFDDFKPSPIIEKAKMKYKLNSRLGNIAPDTFGVDNCFITRFFNYEMYMDFQAIEKDFLKNCYDNILTSKIQLVDDGHYKKIILQKMWS